MKKILPILGSAFLALVAQGAAIVFTDGTFDLANYSETPVFTSSTSDTVTFDQCPSCGNPGQALQIQMSLPGNGDLAAIGFINNTFAYNPMTQGAIRAINASVDKNIISNLPIQSPPPFTNTFRPMIEQDGLFYLAAIHGPNFTGGITGYNTIMQTGLVATDFTQFNFSTGTFGTANPNFAGDPMLFGLAQITQIFGFPNTTFEADYDNLRIGVSAPDSGATIVLLLGSAAALLGLRRLLFNPQAGHLNH